MSTWPSVLSTISDPTATNRLNSPSHSSIETAQNDAIKKLETFIGTSASAVGTIIYDVRAAASDGGGHVQGANKGGTGQTSFAKGDILVAKSSSVLSKLAVGNNNQILQADSAQDVGVKWGTPPVGTRIASSGSVLQNNQANPFSVMGVTIPGSTLSTYGGIKARVFSEMLTAGTGVRYFWRVHYGKSILGTIQSNTFTPPASSVGVLEVNLMPLNDHPSSQMGFIRGYFIESTATSVWSAMSILGGNFAVFGTLAVDSNTNQQLDIEASMNNITSSSIISRGHIVERLT